MSLLGALGVLALLFSCDPTDDYSKDRKIGFGRDAEENDDTCYECGEYFEDCECDDCDDDGCEDFD